MFDAVKRAERAINDYKKKPEAYKSPEEFVELNIKAIKGEEGFGRTFSEDVKHAIEVLKCFQENPESDEWEQMLKKIEQERTSGWEH